MSVGCWVHALAVGWDVLKACLYCVACMGLDACAVQSSIVRSRRIVCQIQRLQFQVCRIPLCCLYYEYSAEGPTCFVFLGLDGFCTTSYSSRK